MEKIGELRGELEVFEDDEKYKFVYEEEGCSDYYLSVSNNREFRVPIGESTFSKSNFGDVSLFVEHDVLTGRLILNKQEKNSIVIKFSENVDLSEVVSLEAVYDNSDDIFTSERAYVDDSTVVIEDAVIGNEYNLSVEVDGQDETKTVSVTDIPTDVDSIDLTTFGKEIEVKVPEESANPIGVIKVYHYKNEPSLTSVRTESDIGKYDVYVPVPNKIPAKGAISKANYRIEYNPQKRDYKIAVLDDIEDYPDYVEFDLSEVSKKDSVSIIRPSWFIGTVSIDGRMLSMGREEYQLREDEDYNLSAKSEVEKIIGKRSTYNNEKLDVVGDLSNFIIDIYLESYDGEGNVVKVIQDEEEDYIIEDKSRINVNVDEGCKIMIINMGSGDVLEEIDFSKDELRYVRSVVV